MSLQAGSRIGSFEILSPIGAGGMGEVYRARDHKLNRDVALKILPDSVSADPDRLARFKREAQLLASLNHANIAAIYGMEDNALPCGAATAANSTSIWATPPSSPEWSRPSRSDSAARLNL